MPSGVNYDRISEHYDGHRRFEERIPRRLLELTCGVSPAAQTERILEIGCGTGNVTHWLAELFPGAVVGLDASRGMLAKARRKVARATFVRADAARLPFARRSFAAAVGTYFLHHLDTQGRQSFFAALQRVLRAKGRLAFLTSGHEQIHKSALARWFPSLPRIDCARFPDLPVLSAELERAGFDAINFEVAGNENPRGDANYVRRAKGRFVSTLELLPPGEFEAGITAMESQLARDGHLGDVSWQGTIVSARIA